MGSSILYGHCFTLPHREAFQLRRNGHGKIAQSDEVGAAQQTSGSIDYLFLFSLFTNKGYIGSCWNIDLTLDGEKIGILSVLMECVCLFVSFVPFENF